MSQEKVDRYKKEKANRKKTNARNKVKRAGYKYYENSRPVECYKADLTAVNDYINGLTSTEATESDAQ